MLSLIIISIKDRLPVVLLKDHEFRLCPDAVESLYDSHDFRRTSRNVKSSLTRRGTQKRGESLDFIPKTHRVSSLKNMGVSDIVPVRN